MNLLTLVSEHVHNTVDNSFPDAEEVIETVSHALNFHKVGREELT